MSAYDSNDWRLGNQMAFLGGKVLVRKTYTQQSGSWDHDHCAFCWKKFPDEATEGYCTLDGHHWVCETCFDDFKDSFHWTDEVA
jgi:hypothetical protein